MFLFAVIHARCLRPQVWPRSRPALSLGPHVDSQSEELLATTYLGPVEAKDGPFTIWPGSHASMWCASDEEINRVQNDEFKERMDKIRAETQPLLFTGDIGDTIFVGCAQLFSYIHKPLHCSYCSRIV